jgi:FkbH-like protein
MNMRLQERLSNIPGLFLLDSARWIDGSNGYSPKLWYLSKTPFTLAVFKNAVIDIEASWNAFTGKSKKVIICDLDDTIWGGIVGDDGWENLQLGGHDPIGESMIDFQHKLKELSNRGILLSIVSKNTEAVALEAIEKHPEMILRKKNFSSWRINWNDKAQNIVDLMKELNLGLDSAVFLDDNPIERSRVREALPDVLVPEMPVDKLLYPSFLAKLNCFDTSSISPEDRRRTEEYSIERERRESRKESSGEIKSVDDWLQTLGVEIIAEKINKNNSQRAVQLLNKTNQFNLSTRRLSEDELFTWLKSNNRDFFVYRVKDKFSDSGITGIASYEISEKVLKVIDFILSCRVMGRRVEEAIYYHILEKAKLIECKSVVFEYLETKKNLPCLNFLKSIKFKNIKNQYIWDVKNNFTMPKSINLCEKNE